ncbi:MAG: O-methyltransferase [Bacteroidales bacterium]|nr:MAG: O-methyltransferase [Bacteroidales bacterium]
MHNLNPNLEKYILNHTDPEGEVLEELNRYTHANILNPNMLAGHLQGKILEMISRMISPSNILEIGTYTGYSAICLAKGLRKGGKLTTIDCNDELSDISRNYFIKAGADHLIESYQGDALDIIPGLKEQFDLVFIDGEKEEYLSYYKVVFDKVKRGGYILADNALWGGKITGTAARMDKSTSGIADFNNYVHQDTRVQNLILPVRDGLMILRKKE